MPDATAHAIGESYDARADDYVAHVSREMEAASADRAAIRLFAEMVGSGGSVLDAGCGPGHIAAFLSSHGLEVTGLDASASLIDNARNANPAIPFSVGDLADVPFPDQYFAGVIARHSLIHTPPARLGSLLGELVRVLRTDGVLFVSFFAAPARDRHGQPFDHAVCTAYEFDPDAMADLLADAGVVEEARVIRQPGPDERQLAHVSLVARGRRS